MANYAILKDSIQQYINENHNNEITGAIMQSSLLSIIDSLGADYQFGGIATPTTNPGTPDQKLFFIATTAGAYSNFGGIVLDDGDVAILQGSGGNWIKQDTGIASLELVNEILVALYGGQTMVTISPAGVVDGYGMLITDGSQVGDSSLATACYAIEPGKRVQIHIPKAANENFASISYVDREVTFGWNAGWVTLINGTTGTDAMFDFAIESALNYPYILVTYQKNSGSPTVKIGQTVPSSFITRPEFTQLDQEVNGTQETKTAVLAYDAVGKYINGENTNGDIYDYEPLALAYYPVRNGVTYHISVPKTTNAAGWELGFSTAADGATPVRVLTEYGKGTWGAETYDVVSDFDGFIAVGYATGSTKPTVTYVDSVGGLVKRIEALEREESDNIPPAIKKAAMFFGDSLTSASSVGVVGFVNLIAQWLNVPYRPFVYDSNDGNTQDVPVDYVSYTNYAKDGTCNRIVVERPNPDSVIERVKRHITADANVSLILVECCVNDMADAHKGVISESYTGPFDEETTLGAIEETIRYITTLGRPFKLGFYIPWKITWGEPAFFDDHILVFKKWGIPYLDLRDAAGFNMRDCAAQRIYSLATDSYPTYSPTTTYNTDNMVKYGGMIYKCRYDGVVGIEPTNSTYWIEIPGGSFDGTHLNSMGHDVVCGKIRNFLESL